MSEVILTDKEKADKKKKENELKKLEKLEKLRLKQEKKKEEEAAKKNKPAKETQEKNTERKVKSVEEKIPFVNKTKPGEKKDMSIPMSNSYDPMAVESSWYSWWENKGFMKPTETNKPAKENYSIMIPPPNVTGSLHLGHSLTIAIQDCMIRWNRMNGKSTLYLPGVDHAGIATQVVVEKRIAKERGITRHDLGREKFVEEVWKWKEQYGNKIYSQLKRLGSSNDWSRATFTMDPKMCKAVNETFVQLHKEGIIYRENRLVNWCTKLRTALSNLEVENVELEGKTLLSLPDHDPKKKYEFGVIISFAYQVENSNEKIVVATTRIETMLGDTGVIVNPKDTRYQHLVGKNVIHPFNKRLIPICADDYADMNFGTGAVKITPAHDFNDFQVAKRNKLEIINIFTDDGKVNENGGEFEGMQRFDARVAVIEALKKKGLYVETKDNKMMLPMCVRSNNVVEPLLKPQWWVNCEDMAKLATECVKSGELEIIPKISENEFFRWMDNINDWCISRQLWWGHRIPAYLVSVDGVQFEDSDKDAWISGRTHEEALQNAQEKFPGKNITLSQDPDVLDTWFSAALWPFATLGWPEKTLDLDHFYPNSLLETGWDILFFWVARMVMFGKKLTGVSPFKKVFCHAMVRDAHGRKMSKSLGNVIDPLDVIEGISLEGLHKTLEGGNLDPREVVKAKEGQKKDFPNGISQCGADALRFTLLTYTTSGRDLNLDVLRIEGYRKFCNKLWNATKFAIMKLGDDFIPAKTPTLTGKESLSEQWILSRLNSCIKNTNTNLKEMNFMVAANGVYNFWLYELCDVYIEISKNLIDSEDKVLSQSAKNTLHTCLDFGLKLLHPMMPFVTEELYQRLPRRESESDIESISISSFPQYNLSWENLPCEQNFITLNAAIHASRSLIIEYDVKGATVYIQALTPEKLKLFSLQKNIITGLVKGLKTLNVISGNQEQPEGCALINVDEDTNVYLLVKGFVNFEEEILKYESKLKKIRNLYDSLEKKTLVKDYLEKVREDVRESNTVK
ncbi:hypothetical protein HK099_002716, partial [Clydaea vesicula]